MSSTTLAEFTDCLVPISDFSQGKASKIFADVSENQKEYVVLKNNQPTAVVLSVREYREQQQKLQKFENLLNLADRLHLQKLAESRLGDDTVPFDEVLREEGISIDELKALADEVEFEA